MGHRNWINRPRRGNVVLVIMAIVAAIVITIVFAANQAAKNPPKPKVAEPGDAKNSFEIRPSLETGRILAPGTTPEMPYKDQAVIPAEGLMYKMFVDQEDEEGTRGEIIININPDGLIGAGWRGDYNRNEKNYVMSAGFEGNIDPECMYFDENGENTSRLFFIARGQLDALITDFKTQLVGYGKEEIYLSGWIDRNLAIDGRIEIPVHNKTREYDIFRFRDSKPTDSLADF